MNSGMVSKYAFPKVTYVVVNWNQVHMTSDCLTSLFKQDYPNYSIILVDNGSEDGSVESIQRKFDDVYVIENGSNLGIAAANNAGIKYALETGSEYVFLLNNDTIVSPDMLSKLVTIAESDPTIGMTGPSMLYYSDPEIIWCAGNQIDWKTGSTTLLRNGMHISLIDMGRIQMVDYIASCAVCIKRSVFEDVGLMDERYFIYYDETDWFARASNAGWKAIYVPWAKMWHRVSAAMGESSPLTDYYMVRNKFLFLWNNLTGFDRLVSVVRACLLNIRTIIAYTVKHKHRVRRSHRNAKIFAMRDAFLGNWGQINNNVLANISSK